MWCNTQDFAKKVFLKYAIQKYFWKDDQHDALYYPTLLNYTFYIFESIRWMERNSLKHLKDVFDGVLN